MYIVETLCMCVWKMQHNLDDRLVQHKEKLSEWISMDFLSSRLIHICFTPELIRYHVKEFANSLTVEIAL